MGLTKRQMKLWATEEGLSKHLDRQCLKEHLSGSDIVGGTLFLAWHLQNDDLTSTRYRRWCSSYWMSKLKDISWIAADWGT